MSAEDIFKYFSDFLNRPIKKIEKNKAIDNSAFDDIYSILSEQPIPADKIALMTKTDIKDVMQKLILMELDDIIIHEIGKGFKLKGE